MPHTNPVTHFLLLHFILFNIVLFAKGTLLPPKKKKKAKHSKCEGGAAYCRTSEEVKTEKEIFKATAQEWATLFHWAPHQGTSHHLQNGNTERRGNLQNSVITTWTCFAIYFHTLQTSQTVQYQYSIIKRPNIHLLSEVRIWGFPGLSSQWWRWADGQLWSKASSERKAAAAPVRAAPGTAHALIWNGLLRNCFTSRGHILTLNNKVTPIILWSQCSLEKQSTWNSSLYYPCFKCDTNKMHKMGNSRNSSFLSLKTHHFE